MPRLGALPGFDPCPHGVLLGLVGSSGNSNAPHLHLEVYDAENNLIDPFQGFCNTLNFESWWISQPLYYDSAINEITTATAPPVFPDCPDVETPNARDSLHAGDRVLFTSYYRDQLSSQTSEHTIYRPDGSTFSSWTHESPHPHVLGTYWYWTFDRFAPEGPGGTWLYEIVFNGLIYQHEFRLITDLPPPTTTTAPPPTTTTAPPPTTTTVLPPTTTTQPCTTLRCSLDAAIRAACAGERVPSSITNKLDRAVSLIEQALSAPTRGKTLRRKAKGALKAAGRAARRASRGKRPTLSGTCAAGIRDAATVIVHRL